MQVLRCLEWCGMWNGSDDPTNSIQWFFVESRIDMTYFSWHSMFFIIPSPFGILCEDVSRKSTVDTYPCPAFFEYVPRFNMLSHLFLKASFLIRALLQIRDAAQACPDPRSPGGWLGTTFHAGISLIQSLCLLISCPRNCAINIMNVISSFAWISHFSCAAQHTETVSQTLTDMFFTWKHKFFLYHFSQLGMLSRSRVQSVDDCGKQSSQEARCGAEISAMIAALTMSPAAGYATTSDTCHQKGFAFRGDQ